MKALAVFKDSFRETLDCRTFWVLLLVSTVLILLCGSLSFTPLSPEEALRDIAAGFHRIVQPRPGTVLSGDYGVAFQVEDPRGEAEGRYTFRLRVSPVKEFHRLVRHWDALVRNRLKKPGDPVPDHDRPADFELERRFLLGRFREQQLVQVTVEAEGEEGEARLYRVRLRPSRPELLHGAHRVGILFGMARFRPATSAANLVAWIESVLADVIAGLFGILFAVVATASFIPDMLQKGRIDVLLSKPIRRSTLLLYKYLGGLLFVLLNALYLIVGCWLALAARSGHWNASFLWSVPVLTGFFAILYGFSAWLGVLTRSPLVSILGTMALWFVSSSVGAARQLFRSPAAPFALPEGARKALEFVYLILPKTADLKEINNRLIVRGNLGLEGLEEAERLGLVLPSWTMIVLTSAGFLAFFLLLACARFSKKDY